jgi:SWI/SNF-related matrix-associated actin-dependent regulator of chromatin subfamily D
VINSGEVGGVPNLSEYLAPHLSPLPAICLPYTIRVDQEFHKDPQPTIYDLRVAVDDPLRLKTRQFGYNAAYANGLKEIAALDDQLSTIIAAIASSKGKHAFLTSFSQDPANFVRKWLSSQKRDLDVIAGETTRVGSGDTTGDEWRRGGKNSMWTTSNARESVNVMLAKQPTQTMR